MDSVQVENKTDQIILDTQLQLLSKLYRMLCNCRQEYEELADIIDPQFHLEECNYREALEKHGYKY